MTSSGRMMWLRLWGRGRRGEGNLRRGVTGARSGRRLLSSPNKTKGKRGEEKRDERGRWGVRTKNFLRACEVVRKRGPLRRLYCCFPCKGLLTFLLTSPCIPSLIISAYPFIPILYFSLHSISFALKRFLFTDMEGLLVRSWCRSFFSLIVIMSDVWEMFMDRAETPFPLDADVELLGPWT